MLRDNESLQVRRRHEANFDLLFTLTRRLEGGGVYRQRLEVPERKLRESARLASHAEQVEQVATLIRFLQKTVDRATGEPDRVTCPRCGWLAGEKKERGEGSRCFNCREEFRTGDDY